MSVIIGLIQMSLDACKSKSHKSKAAQLSGQGTLDLNAVTDGGLDEVDLGDGEEGSVDEALEAGE